MPESVLKSIEELESPIKVLLSSSGLKFLLFVEKGPASCWFDYAGPLVL